MIALLIRLSNQILIGACCLSIIALVLAVVALLRLLPALLAAIRLGLRGICILSFRLYSLVLTWLAPFVQQRIGVDVLTGLPRIGATLILSLALGLLFLAITRLPIAVWSMGLLILHGLVVGLAWDELEDPGGLRLGVKVQ
jgi:hypothetical protein